MINDLLRTEQYLVAVGRGMKNEPDRDIIACGGWAKRYNKLAELALDLDGTIDRKRKAYDWRKRATLVSYLIACLSVDSGFPIDDARRIAADAVDWFIGPWCRFCNGAEALTAEQTECPVCHGAREVAKPDGTDGVLAEISAALMQFEADCAKGMRGWTATPERAKKSLNVLASPYGTYMPKLMVAE